MLPEGKNLSYIPNPEALAEPRFKLLEGSNTKKISGTISKIAQAVVDGNSHYYIVLTGSDKIYDVNVANNLGIILYNEGDLIAFEYAEDEKLNTVVAIE